MKNTIGSSVQLTIFGESHGAAVGAVLDGIAPGVEVSDSFIAERLSRRRPSGAVDTARVEDDDFRILSGIRDGFTTGSPIAVVIPNNNTRSADYPIGIARPSHADYTADVKYHGFEDLRGGGHFSGRVTAGIVAAGAVCVKALEAKGIKVATHILECAGVRDAAFSQETHLLQAQMEKVDASDFPVIADVEDKMKDAILAAKSEGDSVGGLIQTCIYGIPAGVGEPWFDSLESSISRAVFGIGGIKGIEFGSGFGFAGMRGSQANDPFRIKDGKVVTLTNHNGGINGGITNGMPVVFRTAVKPTPSIYKTQQTVDYVNRREAELNIQGRHDPCIVARAAVVQNSLTAFGVLDLLTQRYGTLWQKHGEV